MAADGRAPALHAAGFEALVRAHQSRVRQQLRRLTRGDEALADDLAQETFVLAWRHIGSYRADARVSTWLYRIAYNAFLADRRSAREHVSLDQHDDDEVPPLPTAVSADGAPAVARRLDVERAMTALPEPERLALIHCFQLDLSHAEAAAVLGWPLGTLKSYVARGKARLRKRLAAWNPEPGASA